MWKAAINEINNLLLYAPHICSNGAHQFIRITLFILKTHLSHTTNWNRLEHLSFMSFTSFVSSTNINSTNLNNSQVDSRFDTVNDFSHVVKISQEYSLRNVDKMRKKCCTKRNPSPVNWKFTVYLCLVSIRPKGQWYFRVSRKWSNQFHFRTCQRFPWPQAYQVLDKAIIIQFLILARFTLVRWLRQCISNPLDSHLLHN